MEDPWLPALRHSNCSYYLNIFISYFIIKKMKAIIIIIRLTCHNQLKETICLAVFIKTLKTLMANYDE